MDARERYKGHDRVIAAIPQLVDRGHDVVYVVVGEGNDQQRLVALANKRGVGDRVRFVGAVGRETVIDAYRAADLFLMPSTGEGFGIAFLEAMASGTPVVTSRGGATEEVAGGAAVLVDPHDPAAIAAGIEEACSRREELVPAGLERARAFGWAETARRTADVYREAAA